jgi:hypothetical protein
VAPTQHLQDGLEQAEHARQPRGIYGVYTEGVKTGAKHARTIATTEASRLVEGARSVVSGARRLVDNEVNYWKAALGSGNVVRHVVDSHVRAAKDFGQGVADYWRKYIGE